MNISGVRGINSLVPDCTDTGVLFLVSFDNGATYYSFKNNAAAMGDNKQATIMNRTMVIMITVMSLFMTSALNIYWITTNLFTVVQNLLVKRGKKHEKK